MDDWKNSPVGTLSIPLLCGLLREASGLRLYHSGPTLLETMNIGCNTIDLKLTAATHWQGKSPFTRCFERRGFAA